MIRVSENRELEAKRVVKVEHHFDRCAATAKSGNQCVASKGDTGDTIGSSVIWEDPDYGPTRIYLCARHLADYRADEQIEKTA